MQPSQPASTRPWLLAVVIGAVYFAAIAPTLSWVEFTSGSENLNVATALEIRRTGNWLVPTLQGQARIAKPPLTAWITASLIRQSTLEQIRSPDPLQRQTGYRQLAWDIRWPALLASSLTLAAAFLLGCLLGGTRTGLATAIVCATSYAFLRFSRASTTDVQLMLWVTITNLLLLQMLLARASVPLACLAGLTLALAFLSKGPVALVQTLPPAAVVLAIRLGGGEAPSLSRRRMILHLLGGTACFLLAATPWFTMVLARHGWTQTLHLWRTEVTREGATDLPASDFFGYLSLVPLMLPWVIYFIAAIVGGILSRHECRMRPLLYALCFTLVPVLIMTFFRDRKERYLLPMIPAAAAAAAIALRVLGGEHESYTSEPAPDVRLRKWLALGHVGILVAAGVGFPLVAWLKLRGVDGTPWVSWHIALPGAGLAALLLALTVLQVLRQPSRVATALLLSTTTVISLAQLLYALGYARYDLSRARTLADALWTSAPSARVFSYTSDRRAPQDFSIYLDRAVLPVDDLSDLPAPGDRAQALLYLQRRGTTLPGLTPAWRFVASGKDGSKTWRVYVRDRQP